MLGFVSQHSSRPSKIVVNGRFLQMPDGGVSRVGRELWSALRDELRESALDVRLELSAAGSGTRSLNPRLAEQLIPFHNPGATVLNFCNVTPLFAFRSIVWIHDAHVFDSPATYPQSYRLWHRTILNTARLRSFDVVTVSNYARERLIAHGLDPAKVGVVYNGGDHILRETPDPSVLRDAELSSGPFVLVVGSPARHKNVAFAVSALLARTDASLRIAVLGMSQKGPYQQADAVARDPRVVLLPRVNEGQLRALYEAASVVLSPSLAEGFGLYAAEAMFADSGPLVLSNRCALPEVGGDAALYFDPTDAEALASAVSQALEPATRTRLRAAARVHREKFRWRRAAREVIDRYLR